MVHKNPIQGAVSKPIVLRTADFTRLGYFHDEKTHERYVYYFFMVAYVDPLRHCIGYADQAHDVDMKHA